MDRWAFVHIMKTAGTSFRKMLEETPAISIYPTRDELAAHTRRRYLHVDDLLAQIESGALDISHRQFLCGHFPAAFPERLPGTWRTATFLRDPVRRTLSMIAHNHRQSGRLKRFFKPNVSKFLANEAYVAGQLRDYQTKVFALPPTGNVNGPYAIDDAAFERAKARLLETDFVGLTEQFAQSIALFESISGQRFSPPVYANKGRGYSATDADVKLIRTLVPRDIELYELAREKLQRSIGVAA
jgi:hypothetical protein